MPDPLNTEKLDASFLDATQAAVDWFADNNPNAFIASAAIHVSVENLPNGIAGEGSSCHCIYDLCLVGLPDEAAPVCAITNAIARVSHSYRILRGTLESLPVNDSAIHTALTRILPDLEELAVDAAATIQAFKKWKEQSDACN